MKKITIICLSLFIIICANTLNAEQSKQKVTYENSIAFTGEITKGQKFEKEFGNHYTFTLRPHKYGWVIVVSDERKNEDISRLTPPLHFVPNPRYIEGWHFRNSDNSGPNGIGPKNVNAPSEKREFIFSPEVGRTIQGPDATSSVTRKEWLAVKNFGRGKLTITKLNLNNLVVGEKAGFEDMQFNVQIEWNNRK